MLGDSGTIEESGAIMIPGQFDAVLMALLSSSVP